MIPVNAAEIKAVGKMHGWLFNWKQEFKEPGHQIYKLVLEGGLEIQGLISLEPIIDQLYLEMHLIENAPHNYANCKRFRGVAGNMVAFACKMSFELGYGGFVAFTAKTVLINHYVETLGAKVIYKHNRMGIFTREAKNLVYLYYKISDIDR